MPRSNSRRWVLVAVLTTSAVHCERAAPQNAPGALALETRSVASEQVVTTGTLELSVEEALEALCVLFDERDLDCDRRITRQDELRACPDSHEGCAARLWPYSSSVGAHTLQLTATHELSQLAQELVLGVKESQSAGSRLVRLDTARIAADPASYLRYRIEAHYWDALTRHIDPDPESLSRTIVDTKVGDQEQENTEWCSGRSPRCVLPAPFDAPPSHAVSTSAPKSVPVPTPDQLAVEQRSYLYVPRSDPEARVRFAKAAIPERIEVRTLPENPDWRWVESTTRNRQHGLLSLALDAAGRGLPYVVPGGRFNEMYGWDSFFIVWGLVQDPARIELARAMVDHHVYQLTHYGKVLNANRTYYLTRSQPPFLSAMIHLVYERLPKTADNVRWLAHALRAAAWEYEHVWGQAPRRITDLNALSPARHPLRKTMQGASPCVGSECLTRYFGEGRGQPPETEPGHFDWFYQAHALAHGHCNAPREGDVASVQHFVDCSRKLGERYRSGVLADSAIDVFFTHDRCMRESGHDTTYRWLDAGDERCADYATVDLSSLLLRYALDMATLTQELVAHPALREPPPAEQVSEWCQRANARADLLQRFHWSEQLGVFVDYDVRNQQQSIKLSATTFFPLWASTKNPCGIEAVSAEQARTLRERALPQLEAPGGLMATSHSSKPISVHVWQVEEGEATRIPVGRQWEAPNGWAPHQMIAWSGLARHGFTQDAERLALRWTSMIVENAAAYHGTVPEKFNVLTRSHQVFEEYGNVNAEFHYIAEQGFGWVNASYLVGLGYLSDVSRGTLRTVGTHSPSQ